MRWARRTGRVLRDIPLAEVEANVERILLSAGKDTKFPRPTELRTTPTRIASAISPEALKHSEESWRWKAARNARLADIDLRYCQLQRVIAASSDNSPEHSMAITSSLAIIREHGDPRFFVY
jgi:hypothetical protein